MADRVAVLSHGKLEQFGTPSEVYDRPQTLFVNTFVGSSNRMPGIVVSADRSGCTSVRLDAGAEIIARPRRGALTEGGRVTVCIRPEHLQFVSDDTGLCRRGRHVAAARRDRRARDHDRGRLRRQDFTGAHRRDARAGKRSRGAPCAARPGLANVFSAYALDPT